MVLRLQVSGEPAPGSVESERGQGLRATEGDRQLLGPESVPGSENDDVAIFGAHPAQGAPDGVPQRQGLGHGVPEVPRCGRFFSESLTDGALARLGPPLIRQRSPRNPDQPRERVGGNLVEAPPGHQVGTRDDVRRVLTVGAGQDVREERPDGLPVQILEPRSIDLSHHAPRWLSFTMEWPARARYFTLSVNAGGRRAGGRRSFPAEAQVSARRRAWSTRPTTRPLPSTRRTSAARCTQCVAAGRRNRGRTGSPGRPGSGSAPFR